MNEMPLTLAVQLGLSRIHQSGTAFNPNMATLLMDLDASAGLGGVIAAPAEDPRSHDFKFKGYDLVKFAPPKVPESPTLANDVWGCATEHYGLTAAATALGIGGIPISKIALGHPVRHGSSKYTNLISHFGIKFFPMATLRAGSTTARIAKSTFGTIRIFGIIGRAAPFAAVGLAVFDAISIGLCVYEQRHGR